MPATGETHVRDDEIHDVESIYHYVDSDAYFATLDPMAIDRLRFRLENIGGIKTCEFEIASGVTVLVGENATNRTSTLRGIGASIGADTGTIRADASKASARVDVVTETETTTLTREYTVTEEGAAWTTFSDTAGLQQSGIAALTDFAILLEDNRLRRAVRRDSDLYSVLMSPVDIDVIHHQIKQLREARSELDQEIADIEHDRERLPELTQRKQSLEDTLEEKRETLESKRERLQELQNQETAPTAGEDLTETLQARRQERARIESSIDQEQKSIEGLKTQRADLEAELDSLSVDEGRLETLNEQISTLRSQKRDLGETISSLSTITGVNSDALQSDVDAFATGSEVTTIIPGQQTVECWTCGTDVDRQTIEDRTEELQQLAAQKRARRDELEDTLAEYRSEKQEIEQAQNRRESIEAKLDDIEAELASREQRLTELAEDKDSLEEEIQELETELAERDVDSGDDKINISQDIGELEGDIRRLESDHERVSEQITEISERVDALEDLTDEREKLSDQLEKLRGVVDTKENEIVDRFNDRMDELLEYLEYDNVARVWLEKKTSSDGETQFILNVTREDDAVYEDRVSNLSESEREIVGLMAATVGHTVHNVEDVFPLMVLDSLEAIDASRISKLIEYLKGQTEFLIAALLEEDAQELPDSYTREAPCS
jgi:septal ring factor EnvC (AmiA/AmiB activator)